MNLGWANKSGLFGSNNDIWVKMQATADVDVNFRAEH